MVCIIHIPMRDFQTIEGLIPNFGDRVDDPPVSIEDQGTLYGLFHDLLGQSAKFIQPVLFRSGRLNVYADAAVWGQHIQHRHARLLQACHTANLHVTEIKVKVRPGTLSRSNPGAQRPLSYNASKASLHLQKLAAQMGDDNLGQTVKRLAQRIQKNHLEQD